MYTAIHTLFLVTKTYTVSYFLYFVLWKSCDFDPIVTLTFSQVNHLQNKAGKSFGSFLNLDHFVCMGTTITKAIRLN